MNNKELHCPVERIKKSDMKIEIKHDDEDINVNIKIKNPITKIMNWANKKIRNIGKI